jgi:hypothetical protein
MAEINAARMAGRPTGRKEVDIALMNLKTLILQMHNLNLNVNPEIPMAKGECESTT